MNPPEQMSLLPTIEQARARRDASMTLIDLHAAPDWKEAARRIVLAYPTGCEFLAEDVRAALDAAGYAVHDRRALGPVIHALSTSGEIEKRGYAAARTSNLSPKVLWARR